MRLRYLVAMALLPACSFVGATAEVGFMQLALSGEAALASAQGGVPPNSFQGLGSAMGLNSNMNTPYLRGQVDLGSTVLTASGFIISDEGNGTLAATFGPIASGTAVRTKLDISNLKFSTTFDIGLGPVKISPGVGVDLIDFHLSATESTFGNRGEIDQFLPLPMLFLRVEGDIGVVGIIGEIGYLEMPEIDGADFGLLDFEAMLEFRFFPTMQLFAGYRFLDIDGMGETSDSSFALDATLAGWVIGGGIRF